MKRNDLMGSCWQAQLSASWLSTSRCNKSALHRKAAFSGPQWIVNAYTLVLAALILTAGALGDRFGARRVFIAGFAVFGIGSLGCGLSTSMVFLIGARAFQGIGAAILVSCSLALINQAFTGDAERNEDQVRPQS